MDGKGTTMGCVKVRIIMRREITIGRSQGRRARTLSRANFDATHAADATAQG